MRCGFGKLLHHDHFQAMLVFGVMLKIARTAPTCQQNKRISQKKNVEVIKRCWGRSGSEAGSYLRRIDSCITQLKAHGPSRTCNESKEEDEEEVSRNW